MRKFVQCWYCGTICEVKHVFPKVCDLLTRFAESYFLKKPLSNGEIWTHFALNAREELATAIAEISSAYDLAHEVRTCLFCKFKNHTENCVEANHG